MNTTKQNIEQAEAKAGRIRSFLRSARSALKEVDKRPYEHIDNEFDEEDDDSWIECHCHLCMQEYQMAFLESQAVQLDHSFSRYHCTVSAGDLARVLENFENFKVSLDFVLDEYVDHTQLLRMILKYTKKACDKLKEQVAQEETPLPVYQANETAPAA